MSKKAYQNTAAAATKGATIPKWLQELKPKRLDIMTFLLNAHGGINPETNRYVTPGKRSPVWDNNVPQHNVNIYYEGVGSRATNAKIKRNLDILGMKNTIVNDTWADTSIWVKRETVRILSKNIRDKSIAVEPHNNATKEMKGKAHGSEFFSGMGDTISDRFTEILGKYYDLEFPEHAHRRFKAGEEKDARFGVFKIESEYGIPTILGELFFMDNKKECKEILMVDAQLERIAKIYTQAIVEFINVYF